MSWAWAGSADRHCGADSEWCAQAVHGRCSRVQVLNTQALHERRCWAALLHTLPAQAAPPHSCTCKQHIHGGCRDLTSRNAQKFLYMVDALQAAKCAKKDMSCCKCSLLLLGCTAVPGPTPPGGAGPEAAGGSAAAAQCCSLHLQGAHAGPPRTTRSPPHPAPRQSNCTAENRHHIEQASQISRWPFRKGPSSAPCCTASEHGHSTN